MAKKGVQVGVELTAYNKGYKKGLEDAKKATAEFNKAAKQQAKETEQQFKQVTMAVAKIAGAVVVAKQAFEVYRKAMNLTEGSADTFDKQMAVLEGTMQGFMMTLTTGSWESLIGNMKRTAEATREMTMALDEYENIKAGLSIKKAETTFAFQEARSNAAEATTPEDKQKFLQEAKDLREKLTTIEVEEIAKRLKITENYYRKVTGHSKEYFDYFLQQVPNLAKEYDYYFGENSVVLEGAKARLASLAYSAQINPLTPAKEAERHQLQMLVYVLEDFIKIQDDFSKKGQWNEYIEGISEMSLAAADGEKALVRLVKQLQKANEEVKKGGEEQQRKIKDINFGGDFPDTVDASRLMGKYGLAGAPNAPLIPDDFSETEEALRSLQGTFADLFMTVGDGWEAVGDSLIATMKRIFAEMAAKAAMFILLDILSGGTGTIARAAAGLKGSMFPSGELIGGMNGGNNQMGGLNLSATVRGEDLLFSVTRANEKLGRNT